VHSVCAARSSSRSAGVSWKWRGGENNSARWARSNWRAQALWAGVRSSVSFYSLRRDGPSNASQNTAPPSSHQPDPGDRFDVRSVGNFVYERRGPRLQPGDLKSRTLVYDKERSVFRASIGSSQHTSSLAEVNHEIDIAESFADQCVGVERRHVVIDRRGRSQAGLHRAVTAAVDRCRQLLGARGAHDRVSGRGDGKPSAPSSQGGRTIS
jgi:hypothetical protein